MGRKNSQKKGGGKLKSTLKEAILLIFEESPKQSFNYKQIAHRFQVTDSNTRKLVLEILSELVKQGKLKEPSRGKFTIGSLSKHAEGVIDIVRSGAGYVAVEGLGDIFVHASKTGAALHGDTVRIKVVKGGRSNKVEGRVLEVVQRAAEQYVGTLHTADNEFFVVPDLHKIHVDFLVPSNALNGAQVQDKVVARITQWDPRDDVPTAEVLSVLGKAGEHETEIHAILAAYGLPAHFPKEVEKAAQDIPEKIPGAEIAKRRDFRDVLTFTIDPDDAKDFDDALSIRQLDNGNYEIGVHIADVSHYVRPGDIIDKEAFARATSVYLVDRVVPMLPEKLSNGVCSLRPNEDKLTYSVVFEIDESARVKKHWIGRTAIHSDRRFTYEEAQERIETKSGDLQEEVNLLDSLAKILRKERMSSGALEIGGEEVKFNLDEKGKPLGVYHKVIKDSNKLIEEFMLLANKYVAMSVGKVEDKKPVLPFVYRVHDGPDPEKLKRLVVFLDHVGYKVSNLTPENCTKVLNKLFEKIKDEKEVGMIKTMAIRTMSKAVYSTDNLGHYGLAFRYYSHFTSPIRRYPDLIVHRLLADYAAGNTKYGLDLDSACKHSSAREKLAAEAERESIKYKQVEFMEDKVGLVFPGVVSGVTDFGIFVELVESKSEGLIKMRDIPGDTFYFDEDRYCVVGKRHGKTYYLGDEVDVLVVGTNLQQKQIDFELVNEDSF